MTYVFLIMILNKIKNILWHLNAGTIWIVECQLIVYRIFSGKFYFFK